MYADNSSSDARTMLRGGEWLLEPSDADAVFTPERLTESIG